MSVKRVLLPALVAVGVSAFAVGAHGLASRPRTVPSSRAAQAPAVPVERTPQNVPAAVTALEHALVLRQQLLVPPGQVVGVHAGAASLAGMSERAATLLPSAFSGAALEQERVTVHKAIDALNGPDLQCSGGGADHFNLGTPTWAADGRLMFTGSYRAWSELAQLRSGRAVPALASNMLNFNATMDRIEGQWKVTDFAWTFQPGSEP